jgi:hypothetical protein
MKNAISPHDRCISNGWQEHILGLKAIKNLNREPFNIQCSSSAQPYLPEVPIETLKNTFFSSLEPKHMAQKGP